MTLRVLIAKAYEVAPSSPSHAFIAAGMRLRWIDPDFEGTMEELRVPFTPTDVLPIIETGLDLQHFGFLMRRGSVPFFSTATDRRGIVNVTQDDEAEPFTKNLRSLLSIAATIGLSGLTREDLRQRHPIVPLESAAFADASSQLLTIPGVRRVDDLVSLLDPRELTFERPDEPIPPFKPAPRSSFVSAGPAVSHAEACLSNGFQREALELSEDGLAFIADGRLDEETHLVVTKADLLPRAHLVRLKALAASGDPKRNRDALVEAVEALAALPFVHHAHWLKLVGSMKSLGVVDPQLGARLEAHAREVESNSF
jgi:hypothetical protein